MVDEQCVSCYKWILKLNDFWTMHLLQTKTKLVNSRRIELRKEKRAKGNAQWLGLGSMMTTALRKLIDDW